MMAVSVPDQANIDRFYELLERLERKLGGKPLLSVCHGRMGWPQRGVYFFFEAVEFRQQYSDSLRVVRVGTHAVSEGSKTTLWNRLRQHRGSKDGEGNHRGSIFRLHVGQALLASSNGQLTCPTWGQGSNTTQEIKAQESPMERKVSDYLGQMALLWVAVDDEPGVNSQRAFIERNAIALLAGVGGQNPSDSPSRHWLGNYSSHREIRGSGLWNVKHVGTTLCDLKFLNVLEEQIRQM